MVGSNPNELLGEFLTEITGEKYPKAWEPHPQIPRNPALRKYLYIYMTPKAWYRVHTNDLMQWTSSLMWLTFIATVVVSFPLFMLALQNSPHVPGSTADADFWLLIQSSAMTMFNLAVLLMPVQKTISRSKYVSYLISIFTTFALLCAIAAPAAYPFMPTEWSFFLSVAAGLVQFFMTLQLAVITDNGNVKTP